MTEIELDASHWHPAEITKFKIHPAAILFQVRKPSFPHNLCVPARLRSSGSSKSWLRRHVNDQYVKKASESDLRSRSSFKLLEVQEKFNLIKPDDFTVDLGSSPGGWSLVASRILAKGNHGLLVSIDLLPMEELGAPYAHFVQGDFSDMTVQQTIRQLSGGRLADVVISDMLHNTTGHGDTDHLKSMNICFDVLNFAEIHMARGGSLLCKFFQGRDDKELLMEAKTLFEKTKFIKPKSSRTESKEMYLLATNKIS